MTGCAHTVYQTPTIGGVIALLLVIVVAGDCKRRRITEMLYIIPLPLRKRWQVNCQLDASDGSSLRVYGGIWKDPGVARAARDAALEHWEQSAKADPPPHTHTQTTELCSQCSHAASHAAIATPSSL